MPPQIIRLVLLTIGIVCIYFTARFFLVPPSFGQYGHYRGNAIAEIAAHPAVFAGHQTCETCHSDVLEVKQKGRHARVNCEACHGALAKHAEDPVSVKPEKLQAAVLCVRCHQANIAKPQQFPQVDAVEHSGGAACDLCHRPHSPAIDSGKSQ